MCRACRRLRGGRRIRNIALAKRLGMLKALPAPPEWCPDPSLSAFLRARRPWFCDMTAEEMMFTKYHEVRAEIRALMGYHTRAKGPPFVPRHVRLAW